MFVCLSGVSSSIAEEFSAVQILGAYTTEQAERGHTAYEAECAHCHGEDLLIGKGDMAGPPLAGEYFLNRWRGVSLAEFYDVIFEQMPLGRGATLDKGTVGDIIAYIWRVNGFPSGDQLLTTERETLAGMPVLPGDAELPSDYAPAAISNEKAASRQPVIRPVSNVSEEALLSPAPGDWLMWRRTYDAWGHSPLDQIHKGNVGELGLVWSRAMEPGRNEPAPVVHDGVLYLPNFGSVVQAIDAVMGDLLWEYRRNLPSGSATIKRNLAIYEDRIYLATGDAHIVALDRLTGEVSWDTEVADYKKGYRYTSGPIVVKGLVITGVSGCGRFYEDSCFITAHDAASGEEVWRTYTVARPGEPGGDSWGDLPVEMRAGADVWLPCSYDPEQNLVYCGVAQAKPWAASSRGMTENEAALYTNSTLALRPETGEMVWYHQYLPGESLDMDEAFEQILIDVDGVKSLFELGKTGVLWQIDRATGRYLQHRELVEQNILSAIDPVTGAVTYNPEVIPKFGKSVFQCPTHGNSSWVTTTYDPLRQRLFAPLARTCLEFTPLKVNRVRGGGGEAAVRHFREMPGYDKIGELAAIDITSLDKLWAVEQRAPFVSGLLSTAGGLVFAGSLDRYVRAYDSDNGSVLWQTRLPASPGGFTISYAVEGKQYIAVHTGSSNISVALGLVTPEIRSVPEANAIFVFALRE